MKSSRIGVVLASIAIAGTAIAGEVFAPHQLMARTTASQSLETVIPRQFGTWKLVPEISPVKPGRSGSLCPAAGPALGQGL
ncbi:hypothetical protein ACVW0W_001024 [Bradyrhizobium sp. USDA 4469]